MTDKDAPADYLLLSRGQWDKERTLDEIQQAIDQFYLWYDRLVEAGTIKAGQRLANAGKIVSKRGVTDGPFAEAKEVIGGYWFIRAASLEEAAAIAAENPCMAFGLYFEVRPVDPRRASAFMPAAETPDWN